MPEDMIHRIFQVHAGNFDSLALEIFQYQYQHNPVYKSYVDAIGVEVNHIHNSSKIPFLPIRFFKTHTIKTGEFEPAIIFESSGTTGSVNSRHYIKDTGLYRQSFLEGFNKVYGKLKDWCIIGLLPSYLERTNSSLVFMVNEWISISHHPRSGFYLNELDRLAAVLKELEAAGQPTLLIGVTFALLDLAEQYHLPLRHTIIIETGGMKGRREEMIRQEVHDQLKQSFDLAAIHSEYGMTELLSQAYSKGNGIFHCPPWMQVLLRDEEDPLTIKATTTDAPVTGAINVIDLANIHSCCFIATDDAGKKYPDDSFEVLGRLDNSDIRGCSLLSL